MGGEVIMIESPVFRVKAAGSFIQKPGCPSDTFSNLSSERIDYLCSGECYHPSDERHAINKIEVIKITPQEYAGEPVADLIYDAWKTFDCSNNEFCEITFVDEEFTRDSVYYIRAIQEPTLAINGKQIEIFSDQNRDTAKICKGSYKTNLEDDCLFPSQERAWSSPIFVNKP